MMRIEGRRRGSSCGAHHRQEAEWARREGRREARIAARLKADTAGTSCNHIGQGGQGGVGAASEGSERASPRD